MSATQEQKDKSCPLTKYTPKTNFVKTDDSYALSVGFGNKAKMMSAASVTIGTHLSQHGKTGSSPTIERKIVFIALKV